MDQSLYLASRSLYLDALIKTLIEYESDIYVIKAIGEVEIIQIIKKINEIDCQKILKRYYSSMSKKEKNNTINQIRSGAVKLFNEVGLGEFITDSSRTKLNFGREFKMHKGFDVNFGFFKLSRGHDNYSSHTGSENIPEGVKYSDILKNFLSLISFSSQPIVYDEIVFSYDETTVNVTALTEKNKFSLM